MNLQGTVKWFSPTKGYGFIEADDQEATQGRDVFAHHTAIEGEGYRNLTEGERVSFDLVDYGKGPQARNVKRLHAHVTASELS